MRNARPLARNTLTPARRGHIIQRVIVDGWSAAQVAHSFGVDQQAVEAWVAEFRRSGMASLRQGVRETISGEIVWLSVSRPILTTWRRITIGLRRFFPLDPLIQPIPLRQSNEDGSR